MVVVAVAVAVAVVILIVFSRSILRISCGDYKMLSHFFFP